MELKDRVAIVTGAASGIGRKTSLTFINHGATVVAVDRQEKELHETAAMIGDQGGGMLAYCGGRSQIFRG